MTRSALAVIGAGHAGLSAATSAAGFGIDVLLFDQFAVDAALPPNIRRFDRTAVWGLFPGWAVAATRDGDPVVEQVDAVILATGSSDRAVPFAGGSQPGAITSGALHRLVTTYRLLPGQRFVIIGDGEEASAAAECVESAGGEIVLRVSVAEAREMTAYGPDGIARVELGGRSVDADIVVIAAGRSPDVSLAAMTECELCFDLSSRAWVVKRDAALHSSVPGVWAAGDIAGCTDAETAKAEGRYAAARVARRLGAIDDARLDQERTHYECRVSPERRRAQHEQHATRQPWAPALLRQARDAS